MDIREVSTPNTSILTNDEIANELRIDASQLGEASRKALSAQDYVSKKIDRYIGDYELRLVYSINELIGNKRRNSSFSEHVGLGGYGLGNQPYTDLSLGFLNAIQNFSIRIDIVPLIDVTSVSLYSSDNTAKVLDKNDDFEFTPLGTNSILYFKRKAVSGLTNLRASQTLSMECTAGYTAENCPPIIKETILRLTSYLFERRGDVPDEGNLRDITRPCDSYVRVRI